MPKPTVDRMLAGFKSFKAMYYEQRPERVEDLVNMGQKPEVLLIACSDSRVDPAHPDQCRTGRDVCHS